MKLTEPLGPTSRRLFKFLKEEGVLEEFVSNCKNINQFVHNQDGGMPDSVWNEFSGAFYWHDTDQGTSYWTSIARRAEQAGVYNYDTESG